ncbi:MAG: CDP-alcohol phosphatidyltransferase family protein [Bacteroidetes bacterium]|nr:CDP-alcohol phosphatidyltransferase family protein [Bacteroidota bacterium]
MKIPHVLILIRFLLAPIILSMSYFGGDPSRIWLILLIFIGLISDILDGIIARKLKISSVQLRRLDSQVDLVFWLAVGLSCYILSSELLIPYQIGIWTVISLEIGCYLSSFLKFGKETCTHAFLSKIWGLLLFSTFISIIGFSYSGVLLPLTISWGIISQIDVILIVLILPKWQNDIPSFYHAYLIRKGIPFRKSKFLND